MKPVRNDAMRQPFMTKIRLSRLIIQNIDVEASPNSMNNFLASFTIKAPDDCPDSSHFHDDEWIKRILESSMMMI